MSAFIVDSEHIQALVAAAHHYDRPGRGDDLIRQEPGETGRAVANRIGRMLWRANVDSVSFRYPDGALPGPVPTPDPDGFAYREQNIAAPNVAAIVKAIDGYRYQSCERPEWQGSEAELWTGRLLNIVLRSQLRGYDDAPTWSVDNARHIDRESERGAKIVRLF